MSKAEIGVLIVIFLVGIWLVVSFQHTLSVVEQDGSKVIEHVNEHGLKSVFERVWEGKNSEKDTNNVTNAGRE
jgi:hypothetical protein